MRGNQRDNNSHERSGYLANTCLNGATMEKKVYREENFPKLKKNLNLWTESVYR